MVSKVKNFFIKIKPSKRKIIQVYAALLFNANIKGFLTGTIFEGVSKTMCAPGLNCYSCPGAIGACPLGSLQNALAASKTKLPTYILGIILLYSIILGRTICGFLCPMGLIQELLYKIKSPKLRKSKITRMLSYFKYVLLVVLVVILPLVYAFQQISLPLPAFCKYICPAGTFEGAIGLLSHPNNADFFGMLGPLFTWKFLLLVIFITASVFIFRFFCRFFCPLGAIYGFFNKLSIVGVKVDMSKCNHCNACITNCKMDVKEVGDHECIQCGECQKVCHCNAISWKSIKDAIKKDLNNEEKINQNDELIITEENVETKSNKVNKEKRKNIIISSIAAIVLIVVLVLVNFQQTVLEINEVCDELVITLDNNEEFNMQTDNLSTILYFYETLDEEVADTLKAYKEDNLNIILISNNQVNDEIKSELEILNIKFASDNKNKILKKFVSKVEYPYSIFLDTTDKILIKTNNILSADDYNAVVSPILLGKTVGNQVGDICINKELDLIGTDETFSVVQNRGKITIINFWYTTCTPCVAELPYFNKVYTEYKDDVTIVAVHSAEADSIENAEAFINSQFKGFEILFAFDDIKSPYYTILGGKKAWPTTVIVDQEGIVTLVNHGSLTEEELVSYIETLLN